MLIGVLAKVCSKIHLAQTGIVRDWRLGIALKLSGMVIEFLGQVFDGAIQGANSQSGSDSVVRSEVHEFLEAFSMHFG